MAHPLQVLAASFIAAGVLAASTTARADDPQISESERAKIESVVHDYIMAHPEVVLDSLKAMQARQQAAEDDRVRDTIAQESDALRHAKGDFVAGNPKGDVTLVEFFDYNCTYCRQAASSIQSLLADDPKLRIIFKEWPIRGDDSMAATRVSLAAQGQPQFLAFHFALMKHPGKVDEAVALQAAHDAGLDMTALKKAMQSPDIDARLAQTGTLAQKIGLQGTPAFVVGDEIIPGAVSEAEFRKLIAETRASCSGPSC